MANPLTLFMPVVPGTTLDEIGAIVAEYTPQISKALAEILTVHYARVMLLDASIPNLQPGASQKGSFVLAIITEYDGSFNPYIQDFVAKIGAPFFDALLPLVVGGCDLVPIMDHIPQFEKYTAKNDASQYPPNNTPGNHGLYEAYPYTVPIILADCAS